MVTDRDIVDDLVVLIAGELGAAAGAVQANRGT
jgi:hypothetical protein